MAYVELNSSDTQDLYSLFTYINTVSGNIFWPFMLAVIWVIWVLGGVFIGKPFHRVFLFANFLCSVIAVLFVIMNWLSPNYMYFLFFLTAIGLIWTKLTEAPS